MGQARRRKSKKRTASANAGLGKNSIFGKALQASSSGGYTANVVVAVIATLVGPSIVYLIGSPKPAIVSAALGVTISILLGARLLRRVPEAVVSPTSSRLTPRVNGLTTTRHVNATSELISWKTLVISAAAGIIILTWLGAVWLVRHVPEAITVSPTTFNLSPNFKGQTETDDLNATSEFQLQNHADRAYYQIYLKVSIDSPSVEPEQIRVEFPTLDGHLVVVGKDTKLKEVSPEAHGFYGVDKDGRKALFLFVSKLAPRQILPIILSSTLKNARPKSQPHIATLIIKAFSTEPAELAVNSTSGSINIVGPETISIRSVGLLEPTR